MEPNFVLSENLLKFLIFKMPRFNCITDVFLLRLMRAQSLT